MEGNRRKSRFAPAMIMLVALPLFYVLSSGPAVYLWCRGVISDDALNAAYHPLNVLCVRSETVNYYLSWYMEWWNALGDDDPRT